MAAAAAVGKNEGPLQRVVEGSMMQTDKIHPLIVRFFQSYVTLTMKFIALTFGIM